MTLTRVPNNMLAGAVIPVVTSINAIKSDSLNPDEYPIVRLRTNSRDQEFEWLAGNYTTRVAADVYNGRYIKKDSVAASLGCWVALPRTPTKSPGIGGRFQGDAWYSAEFDVPRNDYDAAADPAPYFAAMWNLANIDQPGILKIDLGLYTLSARFPELTYTGTVVGSDNVGFQTTILQKAFVEADANIGIMPFTKWGFTMRDLRFQSTGPASGGSAYSCILNTDDTGPNDTFIERVYVSATGVNYGWYVDGRTAVTGTAVGYRTVFMRDCQFLNSASYAIKAYALRHWLATGCIVANTGGPKALYLSGDATVNAVGANMASDDIRFQGLIAGEIDLDVVERCSLLTDIGTNVTNTANTKRTTIIGSHYAGTVQSNWIDNSGLISPV